MPKYGAGGYKGLSATELLDKLELREQRLKTSGKIMRYLRKKTNLNQKGIAEKLNIAQQTYAGYENGQHEPSIDILIQIADFHNVTLDFLSGHIFDEWIIETFSHIKENGDGHLTDLINHSKMQYSETREVSDMVMEAHIHGEYSPSETNPSTNYRKFLRMKIKPPNEEVK